MKYLKLFNTHAEYEEARQNLVLPNVSHCIQEVEVHYNPFVETRVVCKYNVTSTSEPTALRTNYDQNVFKSMEIDGVMLDELVTAYTFDSTGVHTVKYELYDETKLGNNAPTFYNSNLIEATIPSSVTSIGNLAFYLCTSLSSCTIGSGVISISNQAFQDCSGLTSIDIPNSVTSIGERAFERCSRLTSITIGSGVTSIGYDAFWNCSSLTSVTIPNSVTSIGDTAFASCYALTSCTFEENSQLTSIGTATFSSCSGLTSVVIPDSVTSIGDGAFVGCNALTSVAIGSGVTSIGGGAFSNCSGLTSITSNATTAPTIQSNTFQSVITNGTLYVPIGSSGYNIWMQNANYYLGLYNWTKVEQ